MSRGAGTGLVLVTLTAVPGLALGQVTSPDPEYRACNPFAQLEQSANPVLAVPLEISHGLIAGRTSRTPYTWSIQAAGMVAPVSSTRRFKLGPTVGFNYSNPDVKFMAGLRTAYRIWALPLEGTDLGIGLDAFAEGAWEAPSTGLASVGLALDLSLVRLLLRGTYDATREEGRIEVGLGRALFQRYGSPPVKIADDTTRWRFARSEFAQVVRVSVSENVIQTPPDTALLCDYTALKHLARLLPTLKREASRSDAALTLDGMVLRFREDSLLALVARLERSPQRWRREAIDGMNKEPPVPESAAVQALLDGLRSLLHHEFGVRSDS